MATDERELTHPVDLCLADGRLNPDATGWSRIPLHTGNLPRGLRGAAGWWGRNKRWDYWAILAGDLVVSFVYADIDYLGLADVWWVDLATGQSGGAAVNRPGSAGISLPDLPGSAPLRVADRRLHLEIVDDDAGTHFEAHWVERDGTFGRIQATVALPPGHESLNVVIPWSERRYQYTSKHQARPAHGELVVAGRRTVFGSTLGDAWGVLDVGRGRWPYRTRWNWGGGAGPATTGEIIGLQLGGKWTVGTGATENAVIVNGHLTKVGVELDWRYDWGRPLAPWTVTAPDGSLELELRPAHDKYTKVEAGVLGTETHQVFGRWRGRFTDDAGRTFTFDDLQGFAEESRSRW